MKPICNAPSFGTTNATASRITVIALMLVAWMWLLPLILVSPYLVTLRAAWFKPPVKRWRAAVLASLAVALALALLGSPLCVPAGVPFPLPTDDPWFGPPMPGLTACVIAVNALVSIGVALLPLATASTYASLKQNPVGRNRCK